MKPQSSFLGYDFETYSKNLNMSNKLFCTFTEYSDLENTVHDIKKNYRILYEKIFILTYQENGEDRYVCTYNVDLNNVLHFLDNSILVHRKKHTNTLYTINALNELIKELNKGTLDKSYSIRWKDYKNTLLLTKGNKLHKFRTFLHDIVEI